VLPDLKLSPLTDVEGENFMSGNIWVDIMWFIGMCFVLKRIEKVEWERKEARLRSQPREVEDCAEFYGLKYNGEWVKDPSPNKYM
jgi:hypothetical protein